jgi:hypothetical protein
MMKKKMRKNEEGKCLRGAREGQTDALGRPSAVIGRRVRYKVIGGSQPVPLFRFTKAVHQFRMIVTAGQFKTKAGLTIAGNLSQIKGAAAAYGWALAWSIGDLPFNMATLFDQFRIVRVIVRISASNNTNATGAGSRLYVVTDYDNSNLLTGPPGAGIYQNCQVIRGSDTGNGESIVVDLVPAIPITSLAGNMIVSAPWQDLAVTTNTHYGVKGWYQTGAATDPVWDVDAQYFVECMNTQ